MNAPVLQAITGNSASELLNWEGYIDPFDAFKVYRKLSSESTYSLIVVVDASWGVQKIRLGVDPSTAYDHYVTAVKDSVESAPSNVVSFTSLAKPPLA